MCGSAEGSRGIAGFGGDCAGVGCGVGEGWGNVFTAMRGGCCTCTGAGVGVARGAGETEGSFVGSKVVGAGWGAGVLEVDGGGTDEGVAGGLTVVGGGTIGCVGAVAVMPSFCRWMASNTFQLGNR